MPFDDFDPQLFSDFLDESLDTLAPLDRLVLGLPADGRDFQALASIFRPVHSLKGNAGFFRLVQVKRLAHALEDVLDGLRTGKLRSAPKDLVLEALGALRTALEGSRGGIPKTDDPRIDALVVRLQAVREPASGVPSPEGSDPAELERLLRILQPPQVSTLPREAAAELESLVAALAASAPADSPAAVAIAGCQEVLATILPVLGYDPVLRDLLLEKLGPLPGQGLWNPPAPSGAMLLAPPPSTDPVAVERTMRIPERSIDGFLGFVGELVVVEEVFQFLNRQLVDDTTPGEEFAKRFRQNTDTFSALSRALRESILQLRRLPARQVLQKVPRLVHDVAARCGKSVRVEIVGDDIQLDKSHLDLLDAPITHLVNNAVDHGIESPPVRQARGKPAEGSIRLEVRESDDHLVLEIRDDGAGLDLEALRAKGEAMGLVAPGQTLETQQIVSLLFQPGLSTAATVTDVSGRGVGMDVVRRQIVETGGRIEVETERGRGTVFRVLLPHSVRTQIIEGFVVRVGDSTYLFPLGLVGEVFPLDDDEVHSLPGRGEVVSRSDRILPLVRLQRLLNPTDRGASTARMVVVVQLELERLALLVDEVLGIRKTVIKPLGAVGGQSDLYEGVGMMGDGSMSLILGPAGLTRLAGELGGA